MYRRLVWDLEANGLLSDSTKIWCLVAKDIDTNKTFKYLGIDINEDIITSIFRYSNEIIGHNIITYDIPMIKKFYGVDLIELLGKESIVDTYLISKVLDPDREMPKGCPTTIRCQETGRSKRIGPHGLESWGYRIGEKKIEIHDWLNYSDNILERCEVDVDINIKVYHALMKEANMKSWRE